ncbi:MULTISPECIES: RibD family protein [Streptomyces]|uniref:RibD family protein n=1 Tax=Streptomyces TaxID=1883 RepID=UPI0021F8AA63|nr:MULTISPECIES: dihydrofolate reductase family protein [Streptomyces]
MGRSTRGFVVVRSAFSGPAVAVPVIGCGWCRHVGAPAWWGAAPPCGGGCPRAGPRSAYGAWRGLPRVLTSVVGVTGCLAVRCWGVGIGHGVAVVRLPRAKEGLDLDALLRELSSRGVRGMFLEGGPTLAASFVSAGLVDRVIAYIAPALLGRGKSALQGGTIETMEDILRCELLDVARSGPDIRLIARPRR